MNSDLIRLYLSQGWALVPIPRRDSEIWSREWAKKIPADRRGKIPILRDWSKLRSTDADFARYFRDSRSNAGIILGDASGQIVDVDLDCDEAVELAPKILPSTLTFGRASKPRSHWLYRSKWPSTEKWLFEATSTAKKPGTIIELRSNGGQTVLPGSIHPSGETIEWTDGSAEITEIEPAEIYAYCQLIAGLSRQRRGQRPEMPKRKETTQMKYQYRIGDKFASYDEACAAWNADHDLPDRCPHCKRRDAWKHKNGKWFCFHSSHPDDFGGPGRCCRVGDALDIACWETGRARGEVLRANGYL